MILTKTKHFPVPWTRNFTPICMSKKKFLHLAIKDTQNIVHCSFCPPNSTKLKTNNCCQKESGNWKESKRLWKEQCISKFWYMHRMLSDTKKKKIKCTYMHNNLSNLRDSILSKRNHMKWVYLVLFKFK